MCWFLESVNVIIHAKFVFKIWINSHEIRKLFFDYPVAAKSLQSCPTLWDHRQQPTRLPHPWDSLGKNTGAGCHFLLQCMKVKSESEVAQSCPTLSDPMDCSLPGSSFHGIFQAKVLEWVASALSGQPKLTNHKYITSNTSSFFKNLIRKYKKNIYIYI